MLVIFRKENLKKRMKKFAGAVLVAVCGFYMISGIYGAMEVRETMVAENDGNWGLSFSEEGKRPEGNATCNELAEYNAYYASDTKEKKIYITFDAGFENGNTEKILDSLKKHNAPACFFVVGNYLDTAPEIVKRMVREGHTVGNHTMHHPDMSKLSAEEFTKELTDLEEKYKEVTGEEMKKFYRPPQGKYCRENLIKAKELGYRTIFWSLAHVDWYENDQPDKEEAFEKLIPRIHPGAIVLLHSTSKTNAEILDELLTKWENLGYSFDSIQNIDSSEKNN